MQLQYLPLVESKFLLRPVLPPSVQIHYQDLDPLKLSRCLHSAKQYINVVLWL